MLPVYVVTIERRRDRRGWIEQQIPIGIPVTYTTDAGLACDGMDLTPEQVSSLSVFPWLMEPEGARGVWDTTPLTVGDIGCSLSHLNCWRQALATGVDRVMILEDDAVLRKTFWTDVGEILAEIEAEDWQLLYLGRAEPEEDRGRLSERIVIPGFSHKTHAYIVTRKGLELLTTAGLDQGLVHIDEFLPAMYVDHPRDDMRARFPKRLRALAVTPPLAAQMDRRWAGSDTQRSRRLPNQHPGWRVDRNARSSTGVDDVRTIAADRTPRLRNLPPDT